MTSKQILINLKEYLKMIQESAKKMEDIEASKKATTHACAYLGARLLAVELIDYIKILEDK
jgi:hypothetical protein